MKSSRINYLAVGGFLIAMLAGLVVAVAMLTGRTGATDDYFTVYDNVAGIKFGTQVLYEGFPVGQVERVTPIQEEGRMRFRVEVSVTRGWRIPEDSIAQIAAPGLLSAITVNIEAGRSATPLKPGDRIPGRGGGNLMAALSAVAGEVTDLSEKSLRPLLASMTRAAQTFGDLLEKDAQVLTRDLAAITGDLALRAPRIADNIEALVDKMGRSTDELAALFKPENRQRLESVIANLDATIGNFAELSRELRTTQRTLDSVVGAIDHLLADNRLDIERSVVDLRYVADSVARHIETINQNLEGASRNMYEFSRHIRQNPGLLLGGTPPRDEAAGR